MRAYPPSGSKSVESRRTSVDFPEPFWPRMATVSPFSIVNETPSRATRKRTLSALLAALPGVLAAELLAQLVHLDGNALLHGHGLHDCFLYVEHLMLLRSRA
jgi:hypothetical protein